MSNYEAEREMWDAAVPRTASTTPVLSALYSRVITGKFTKACEACGVTVEAGTGFAAVDSHKVWHNYCGTCGRVEKLTELVGQMFTAASTTARELDPLPQPVADAFTAGMPALQALVADGNSVARYRDAVAAIEVIRTALLDAHIVEVREGLCDDPTYNGLVLALTYGGTNDRKMAAQFIETWERYGSLSTGRMKWAQDIAARAETAAEKAAPPPVVEPGLYLTSGIDVRRVYRIGRNRLGCRVYNGTVFTAEGRDGLIRVRDGLLDGTARLMTADEATAYGKQHGRCFNCLSIGRPGVLSDDRSLAVGYGPDCADHHGWYYPTPAEAAELLRPTV
jgi:hypothetical protein